MRPIPVILAAALTLAAGAALSRPPSHPLQGQTIDFIASPTGDDADTVHLTINSALIDGGYGAPGYRGEVDMESDVGKDVIAFIRATGRRISDAGLLSTTPVAASAAAPVAALISPTAAVPAHGTSANGRYAFGLTMHEHVVYRMGDNIGPSLITGLTFGLGAKPTFPVSYVTDLSLDVTRSDGAKASYGCSTRVKGGAPQNMRPRPEIWTPMITGARDQCVGELLTKMKADRALFPS